MKGHKATRVLDCQGVKGKKLILEIRFQQYRASDKEERPPRRRSSHGYYAMRVLPVTVAWQPRLLLPRWHPLCFRRPSRAGRNLPAH